MTHTAQIGLASDAAATDRFAMRQPHASEDSHVPAETLTLLAPLSGWCDDLDDVPDPVFSGRVLGDGIAIDPFEGVVHAPCDGVVMDVPASRHAVSIRSSCGVELLIHVGVDTVSMNGEGFQAHVSAGQVIAAGQLLLSFDLDLVARRAKSARTPMLVLNASRERVTMLHVGCAIARGEALVRIAPSAADDLAAATNRTTADAAKSKWETTTIQVGLSHGIHARPAGILSQGMREFDVEIRCTNESGQSANGRSPVGLMSLNIRCGDRLTVAMRGPDARAAQKRFVNELSPLSTHGAPPALDPADNLSPTIAPLKTGDEIRGIAATPGVAVGVAFHLTPTPVSFDSSVRPAADEHDALTAALSKVDHCLAQKASATGPASEVAIAHRALLADPDLLDQARKLIAAGASASEAWGKATDDAITLLGQIQDARMNERVADLKDLKCTVQRVLAGGDPDLQFDFPDNAVVIADEVFPSQLMAMPRDRLAAIATARGGATSHVAILAAALELPMIVGLGDAILGAEPNTVVIVDADGGVVHYEPDQATVEATTARVAALKERQQRDLAAARYPCVMRDGQLVEVMANVGSPSDAEFAARNGADGCGLLRTEILFTGQASEPDIRRQTEICQSIRDTISHGPLTIRTLDAGADKPLGFMPQATEPNPALGVRGVRLALKHRDILQRQIQALLAVKHPAPLRILVPMVSSLNELREVRGMIDTLAAEAECPPEVEIGVMIETPAAAMIAAELLSECDYASIGTNDLTQYTLAMDRESPELAGQIDALHPAVLRLIANTAQAGRKLRKPVAVCGGAAADPEIAPILVGLGINELSMPPSAIPRQKAWLRCWTQAHCQMLARKALDATSVEDVRKLVAVFSERALATEIQL